MGEQHLDFLSFAPRGDVSIGGRDVARHIASALVDGAQDLAGGRVRTAPRLQRTALAIQLAGAITHHAVLIDERPRHSIDFLALPEFLPGRADIAVALVVIVRRQGFRDNGLSKLREALAHRVGDVRRPAAGAASGG